VLDELKIRNGAVQSYASPPSVAIIIADHHVPSKVTANQPPTPASAGAYPHLSHSSSVVLFEHAKALSGSMSDGSEAVVVEFRTIFCCRITSSDEKKGRTSTNKE